MLFHSISKKQLLCLDRLQIQRPELTIILRIRIQERKFQHQLLYMDKSFVADGAEQHSLLRCEGLNCAYNTFCRKALDVNDFDFSEVCVEITDNTRT